MIRLKAPQREVFLSPHRFRVLVAGRRFGKTYLANVELLRAASGRGRTVWYLAPTYRQAKRIAWYRLKRAHETVLGFEAPGKRSTDRTRPRRYDRLAWGR